MAMTSQGFNYQGRLSQGGHYNYVQYVVLFGISYVRSPIPSVRVVLTAGKHPRREWLLGAQAGHDVVYAEVLTLLASGRGEQFPLQDRMAKACVKAVLFFHGRRVSQHAREALLLLRQLLQRIQPWRIIF